MRIRHNAAGMSTLHNSRTHLNRVQNSIEKLSSGSALTRAKDAPADLYQAEMLRSQASGLKQAAENVEHSISLLQTAGSFLGEISSKLTQMRQLAVQAANEATNDPATLEANQYELELLLDSILTIAEKAEVGGKKLLDGSMGVNGVTGDYSRGAAGFWIDKGEISWPGSELTVAGNLSNMFAHLTPANDLTFRHGIDAPTIRIDGMTVAGQQA